MINNIALSGINSLLHKKKLWGPNNELPNFSTIRMIVWLKT